MEPTKKSKPIEDLLTATAGVSRDEALTRGICTWCKGPISHFRDTLSVKEYRISGLCQTCQDQVFGGCEE
jgi:hypothetical protein